MPSQQQCIGLVYRKIFSLSRFDWINPVLVLQNKEHTGPSASGCGRDKRGEPGRSSPGVETLHSGAFAEGMAPAKSSRRRRGPIRSRVTQPPSTSSCTNSTASPGMLGVPGSGFSVIPPVGGFVFEGAPAGKDNAVTEGRNTTQASLGDRSGHCLKVVGSCFQVDPRANSGMSATIEL